ncbi:unnamed protein product [Alopecurus aequalis]
MPSLDEWINEMPRPFMAPAAIAAFVTYRAANMPPRGFWSHDKAGPDGHAAGQPVMATLFPASYAWFRLLNATAFYTSLVLVLLCSSQRFYSTPARMAALHLVALFDLLCVVAVYVFGSNPEDPVRGFANLLPGVLIYPLVYSAVVIGDWATRKLRHRSS